jgi:hypothetical protein
MLIYGRDFKFSQLAKAANVVASAISPLSIRALSRGSLTAFNYSTGARELYDQLAEDDPIPVIAFPQLGANLSQGQEIWLDLSAPPPGMSVEELSYFCSLAKARTPRVVVEIGTYRGFTTLHLSRNTPDTCRIFTVDLPPDFAGKAASYSDSHLVKGCGTVQRVFGNDPKITQILQDSTTIQWENFLSSPIDFAFVDGSHLYEHVRKDTEGVMKALAPNGLVVWHDYRTVEIRRGVRKYLIELYRSGLPLRRIVGTTFCAYGRDLAVHRAAD